MNYPESFYVIERTRYFDSRPSYVEAEVAFNGKGVNLGWSVDINSAIKFADKRSAELFVIAHANDCILGHVVCHGYVQPAKDSK